MEGGAWIQTFQIFGNLEGLQSPISNHQSPITNLQSPITNLNLQT
ncbi:MAG: hypothetical protein ABIG63_04850 [Chloroflexota bacterium]